MTIENPYDSMRTGEPSPTIPKYRWKVNHREFKIGQSVPTYDEGVMKTLIQYGRIELVDDKAIDHSPEDKMFRRKGAKTKW